jgi:hypothetical protein
MGPPDLRLSLEGSNQFFPLGNFLRTASLTSYLVQIYVMVENKIRMIDLEHIPLYIF